LDGDKKREKGKGEREGERQRERKTGKDIKRQNDKETE
jgi:hypothetical protein